MYDIFQTEKLIELWLTEDIGHCDLTVQLMIPEDALGTFYMNAREPMYIAGLDVAARVFCKYDSRPPLKYLLDSSAVLPYGTNS